MTSGSTAPLGRYAAGGAATGSEAPALVSVQLLAIPLRVWQGAADHHDELIRELALLALAPTASTSDLPVRLIELVEVLGRQYGAASARPDAQRDDALAAGLDRLDLVYEVPPAAAEGAQALAALMAECEVFCRSGLLLTMPQPADQALFGQWYLGEFVRQIAGAAPTPWDGPWD